MRWILAIALVALLAAGAWAASPQQGVDSGCRACHEDMRPAMPPPKSPQASAHKLACTRCHLGDGKSREILPAHQGLVANPSALDQAPRACGPCHKGWPQRVRLSPMATAAPLIAMTRYLWGAQPDSSPRFGVRSAPGLLPLPGPAESGELVDDLLRRRCLRCHLWSPGADMKGARRSSGCAACHRPVDELGRKSLGHGLTKKVPTSQCLTCHGERGAGREYVGRIPRDPTNSARFLSDNPDQPDLWQGRSWRPMQPDLHQQAGMDCIDCHPRSEIMGDGQLRPAGLLHVGVRCTTCHGRPGLMLSQAVTTQGVKLKNLHRVPRNWVLTTKLDGRPQVVPSLAGGAGAPIAHQAPGHQRLACHACHSATNPADWGTMVMLEQRGVLAQWRKLAAQGDAQVLKALSAPGPQPPWLAIPPVSRDYLSGRSRPGLWLQAPFFRRFEWRVYGRGPDGRTMLLAPRYGYVVTAMDENLRLTIQAKAPRTHTGRFGLGVVPWHPHTTSKAAPDCNGCHGSARALGLGLTFVRQPGAGDKSSKIRLAPPLWRPQAEGLNLPGDFSQVCDLQGRPMQEFLVPGSGPYPAQLLKSLLKPGKEYKRWLLKALKTQWPLFEADDSEGQPGQHQKKGKRLMPRWPSMEGGQDRSNPPGQPRQGP